MARDGALASPSVYQEGAPLARVGFARAVARAVAAALETNSTLTSLDLRDNPGGYLAEAINIADEFLKDDKLILFTKNKSGAIEKTFEAGLASIVSE